MKEYTQTTLFFDNISGKKVTTTFDGGAMSTDGGVLFLRQAEKRSGVISRLTEAMRERRDIRYTAHELRALLTQRVNQIACGYPEAVHSNQLRSDPALKCGNGVAPFTGADLASQPTISRLETQASRTDLYRMSQALLDTFIDSWPKKQRRLVLDIDETCDPTHGAQQYSLFHAYYDTYCFLPIHIYEAKTGRLVTTILRSGRTPKGQEIAAILKRVIRHIRTRLPKVKIIIRGDSHYGTPEVYELCEQECVWYVLGLAKNKALTNLVDRPLWERVHDCLGDFRGFHELQYQAGSWKRARRVIVRLHGTGKGLDIRYIVTNLPHKGRRYLYDTLYCARGQMENLIKDHKNSLRSDLTSCHSFTANALRLLLHSAAYVLMHEVRETALAGTELAGALFDTIRMRLLKVAARVEERSKVIRFHLPSSYPYRTLFEIVHTRLIT